MTNSLARNAFLIALALGALSLVACDEHDHDHDHGELDEETCEHMANGPAVAVMATADETGAPDVSTAHTRHDVGLVDDGNGMFVGVVSFAADEATDFVVAVDRDVPVALLDGTMPEMTEAIDRCTDVLRHDTFELPVGTALFRFGPTSEDQVRIVIEEAAHEHEE